MPLSGGEAARQGFRYEDWVLLEYFAKIFSGEVRSVRFEGLIPAKAEAIIEFTEGYREVVQCKAGAETWTVTRLHTDGLLQAMLDASVKGNRFRFVSIFPCPLGEVAELANKLASSAAFREEVLGRKKSVLVSEVQAKLKLTEEQTWEMLRCAKFESLDIDVAKRLSRFSLAPWIHPDFRTPVQTALVTGFSDPSAFLGTEITSVLIDSWLERQGLLNWKAQSRADQAQSLQRLVNSFCAPSPAGQIPRTVVGTIVDLVNSTAQTVVVSGSGGSGKTEVLRQVARKLESQGWSVAAVNVRDLPDSLDRLASYDAAVGLPTGLVESLAGRVKPCIILDQLDSEAPALGGSAGRWRVATQLIQLAREHRVRVVLGSRPITDLAELGEKLEFVAIPALTGEELEAIAGSDPSFPTTISATPQLASLWKQMAGSQGVPTTTQQLLSGYRTFVYKSCGIASSELAQIEMLLSDRRSKSGDALSPLTHLIAHESAVDRLVSFGYLSKRNGSVEFAHDVLAEFAWAANFDSSGGTLADLLTTPRLHTNRLVRDLLEFVSSSPDRAQELVVLLTNLLSSEVRPQFVSVALVWLSTSTEKTSESVWPVLRKQIFHKESWRRSSSRQVLRLNCRFFESAFADGTIQELLAEENGQSYVLWIAENSCRRHDQTIEQLSRLITTLGKAGASTTRQLALSHPTNSLIADWVSELASSENPNDCGPDRREAHSLLKSSPTALVELFAAWLNRHYVLATELGYTSPFFWRYRGITENQGSLDPSELAEAAPEEYLRLMGPQILRIVQGLTNPAELEVFCMFDEEGDEISNKSRPTNYAGKILFALEPAIALASPESRKIFDAQRSFHNSASIRVCCLALESLGDWYSADTYLAELAEAKVQTTNWGHIACLQLLRKIQQSNATKAFDEQIKMRTWECGQPWFDDGGGLLEIQPLRSGVRSFVVGSPFTDAETADWDDDKWIEVISTETGNDRPWGDRSGGPHEISQQLQTATVREPERFLSLVERLRPEHPWQYLSAILSGARKLEPDQADIALICQRVQNADQTGHCLAELVDFVCHLEQQQVSEAGSEALLSWTGMRVAPYKRWVSSHDNWVESDTAWRNRIDATAVSGLGRYFATSSENFQKVQLLLDRAVSEGDEPFGGAVLQALTWALPADLARVEEIALKLLLAFPQLNDSRSIFNLTIAAWQRGWAFLPDHWEALAKGDEGSAIAGYRLVGNCFREGNLPNVEAVMDLPELTRFGLARAAVDCCQTESAQTWAAEVLQVLIDDPTAKVREISARWWHVFSEPEGRTNPLRFPQVFRRLLAKTIRESTNFFSVQPLWMALAAGTPEEVREVCTVLSGGTSSVLPRTDLAYGHEVSGQLEIARLAYETLLNSGEDTKIALDAVDELIRTHPEAARVESLFDQRS